MGEVVQFPSRDTGTTPVLTKKQLAVYLQCSTKTIERRVSEGMPSFMLGSRRRFRLGDVETWLTDQEGDGGKAA